MYTAREEVFRMSRSTEVSHRALAIAATGLAAGIAIFAQTMGTGTINGTVTDATGGVVTAVQISATNLDTGITRSTVTNSSGSYVLPALQIGRYRVRALREGFKATTQED